MYIIYALSALGDSEYRYVGITTRSLDRRMKEHLREANKREYPLYRWLRRHRYTHQVHILGTTSSIEQLYYLESMWIAALRASGNRLLNITEGGEGAVGRVQTPDARFRIAEGLRGVKHTDERRKNQSEAAKRRMMTPEGREKRRIQHRGESNNFYGKTHSVESKEANSRTQHLQKHVAKDRTELVCFWCRDNQDFTPQEVKQGTTPSLYYTTKSRHKKRHTNPVRICYFCKEHE